jgi:threonine dehydrogenase-like Zn-dependent dehydrogenase
MQTRCIGDIRMLRDPEAVVRAIVFARPGEFSLTELADPVPGPRDAVVQVEAVGICGTDLHVLDGEFAPTVYPIVPGHETSGTVLSVGHEVTKVAPGDPVAIDPILLWRRRRLIPSGPALGGSCRSDRRRKNQ